MAETSRTAAARRQPPRGVVRRWRQSPSALSVAVFLSKKGKLVRKRAGPSSSQRVPNTSGLNRLGSVLADPCMQPHRFTLAELREITHDFSDEQLLGEGTFGKVYKGVLQNGDTIAVKKLKMTMTVIQDKQYDNEARHLMRLKHPNIVQLVGYCSETKKKLVQHNGIFVYAENSERLLCLEYLPKGNLRGHLSDESSGLDWSTRYKIIEGICYGLHYLHEEWQVTPIIHMDLKPANIMLDGNMVPKITDFGLSRLFGEEQTRTCTRSCNGTPGYMAPEYIDKGIITKKLDIFSLGVIIIEIMTGRKEYPDETETSSQQYIELVLNKWRHRPRKEPGYISGDIDYQQIKRCIQIGLLCVNFDQAKRPTIRQIIKMLDGTEGAKAECIDKRKGLSQSQGSAGERRQSEGTESSPNSPRSIPKQKVADAQRPSPSITSVPTAPPSPGPPPPPETVAPYRGLYAYNPYDSKANKRARKNAAAAAGLKSKMSADPCTQDSMEEEALKAKHAAERKFHARNIKGARRSAIKAHNLCPTLEGISQMITTLDVHLASESKIDGESDWYRILSLTAWADEEEVKKQYRKLALQLHPDKNKSVGAEAAFKLISEAWSVLSDKSRKMLYDQKRRDHSAMNGTNGLYACDTKTNKRARKNAAAAASAAVEATTRPAGADTFWTSCNRCRMQYEYLRIYLNHNLLCPNCNHAFMAVETGFPCNGTSTAFAWTTKAQQQKNHTTVDHSYQSASRTSSIPGAGHGAYQQENTYESYNSQSFQFNQYPKTTGAAAAAANGYRTQTLEKSKRKHEENYIYNYFSSGNEYPSGRGRHSKRRRNINNGYAYASVDYDGETVAATAGMTVIADAGRVNGTSGEKFRSAVSGRKANVLREILQLDTRALLLEKAKAAVHEKLQGLNVLSSQFAEKRKEDRREKHVDNDIKVNGIYPDNPINKCKKYSSKDADVGIPATDELNPEQKRVPVSIDVPDPDFHDFDKDRTERAFGNDQVWATYDSEDGMPRLYAMVQKVISMKPFRIRMSFLNSKSNSELAPINWIASGFTKTCGDFRVGRYHITETVNIFSHRVSWSKGPRGIIRIIPKKGDTWAVYQNWSSDWNELTPDDVIYKYEIVEVIDDFTEEQGVNVIPLLKVAGFKAVFHRHTGPDVVRRIPKEELFRFSHRVPSRLLTGEEKNNAPKGCHELDPAATPVDLLKVIADVKEDTAQGSSD